MAIRQGLIGNPVIQGLLGGGGPAAIKAAKNKALFESMPRGQAVRMSAPGAIVRPPDNSMGQGLSALGKALGDIGDMRAESAAQKDLTALFNPAPSEEDLLEGVEPSAPKVNSQQLATFLAKHSKAPNASKQAGVLYENARREESELRDQDFRREILENTQRFTSKENKLGRDNKKEINSANLIARAALAQNTINSNEKIAGLKMDNAWEVANLKAGKGKTFASTMTFKEFRDKHGSPGLKLPGTTFADNDAVEVVYNNDGTMRGYSFKTKDIVITSEGAFSKTKEAQRMGNASSSGGVDNAGMIDPSAGGASGGPLKLPKPDWKGAAGVITGTVNQIWDSGKEALGFSDTEKPSAIAAARSLKALNNQVIITVATTNAILQKSGKITDFGRKLTQESLPGLGIGQSEAGFGNEVGLVVQRLESSRDQLRTIQEQSTNKKAQREAGDKAIALDGLAKEYRKILESLEPASNRSNNSSIINSADSIVGIN